MTRSDVRKGSARSRFWFGILIIIVAGWLTFISVQIYANPDNFDRGGASPEELRGKVEEALAVSDPEKLLVTFARGADADGEYAKAYLDKWNAVEKSGTTVDLIRVGDAQAVVARFAAGGAALCSGWNIVRDGERFVLDPAPAILPSSCS
ncbi:hypothetical protein SAMN05421805_11840 [Saccharopolyspora antimicrobica]|uniref:Uncharacterized protein n=1 Tax=Saccharopolyspora antimicrobica TaxID=455193 RepID=A0A1I5IB71_9PSEU|nr:hypothetical protein [Saccharopolyspora antimicrobica]RKT85558.1 hypothetical protein ATL45_3905 [Saccharopolyspora antimicrobica]SFO57792.1 hypothetical protein SAMN05421805_11840 [Saccharopolyspora antimicrobica]